MPSLSIDTIPYIMKSVKHERNMIKMNFLLPSIVIGVILLGFSLPSYAQTSAPQAIPDLVAVGGDGMVSLSWSAPFDNGSAITSYKIERWQTGSDVITTYPNLSTATSATVTGLTNNVSYSFKVYAINSIGTGPESNIASATPSKSTPYKDVPDAVTDLKANRGNAKVLLSWSKPSDNGSTITNYVITYWKVGTDTFNKKTLLGGATSGQITGLINGVSYAFKINAFNEIGRSPDSNIESATPSELVTASVPNQVRGLVATPSNGQVFLSWIEPSDNGSPIINYKVIMSEQGSNIFTTFPNLGDATKVTIGSLKNGVSYNFKVIAVNGVGEGKESKIVNAIPNNRVPVAITNLKAIAGDGKATLTWSVTASQLDSISGYRIREYKTGSSTFVTHEVLGKATSVTIDGLTNGITYGFRVVAVNAQGIGPDSNIVYVNPKATSNKVPSMVTNLKVTPGDKQVSLSWNTPSDNGSPITGYNIIRSKIGSNTFTTIPKSDTSTNAIVTGLTNGEVYSFKVSAKNSAGFGPESVSVTAIPTGKQTTLSLPQWIKNNAKWWSEGLISDLEYVQSIEYLINQGIIKIR